jgi:hypothetical protein
MWLIFQQDHTLGRGDDVGILMSRRIDLLRADLGVRLAPQRVRQAGAETFIGESTRERSIDLPQITLTGVRWSQARWQNVGASDHKQPCSLRPHLPHRGCARCQRVGQTSVPAVGTRFVKVVAVVEVAAPVERLRGSV